LIEIAVQAKPVGYHSFQFLVIGMDCSSNQTSRVPLLPVLSILPVD